MSLFKQSTAANVAFLMVSSADNVSPVTGLTPTVTISKNSAAFASPGGSVTEIGNGWYSLAGNTTDWGTLGEFLLHATGAGAVPVDDRHQVVLDLPGATVSSVTGNVAGSVASVVGAVGSVTGAVGSVTGNLGGNVVGNVNGNVVGSVGSVVATVAANLTQILGTALTETAGQLAAGFKKWFNVLTPTSTMNEITLVDSVTVVGSVTGAVGSVTATVAANLTQILGTALTEVSGQLAAGFKKFFNVATPSSTMNEITLVDTVTTTGSVSGLTPGNLDVAVSTRLATSGYTAPDNTDITAIKAKTDNLPAAPASQGDVTTVGTAVGVVGTNVLAVKAKTDNLPTDPAAIVFKKNTAYNGFVFPMQDSSGSPLTGLTVTGVRSIDGAAPAATQTVTEVADGLYAVNFLNSDLNGSNIAFVFSAAGALQTRFSVVTQL